MNAYTYFKNMSLSVEPDMPVEAAGEKEDIEEIIVSKDALTVSETENPINTLNNIMSDTFDSEEITVSQDGNVIALIDTGVGESANVIDRVSVIEEPEASTQHGDAMLQAIVSQNPDAKILSIRAMNSNGFGTISSLVAAMEYAISENVDMINLSLYARTTLSTSVLKSEIQKAVDAGIIVIGAAGNDGVDVVDYVPGSVESAYIIGAAKEDGSRLETSNFGTTVDYNVVAESTSEATALFTGYVSKNGLDSVDEVLNQGMIYGIDYQGVEKDVDIQGRTLIFDISSCKYGSKLKIDIEGQEYASIDLYQQKAIVNYVTGNTEDIDLFQKKICLTNLPEGTVSVNVSSDNIGSDIATVKVLDSKNQILFEKTDFEYPSKKYQFDISETNMATVLMSWENKSWVSDEVLDWNIAHQDEIPEWNPVLTLVNEQLAEEESASDDTVFYSAAGDARASAYLHVGPYILYPGGGYRTSDFRVDVDGKTNKVAYCAEANLGTPAGGNHPYAKLNKASSELDALKFIALTLQGEELETVGNQVFSTTIGNRNKRYVYIHAALAYMYNGSLPGLTSDEVQGIINTANFARAVASSYKHVTDKYEMYFIDCAPGTQDIVWVLNHPKGGLSIQKQSKDTTITNGNSNYSLKGAQYGIWKNANCSGNPVLTLTTDDRGYAKTSGDALEAGTYYVKETKASPGYALDPTIHRKVVVAGDPGIGNSVQSKEPPKTGEGELEKKSDNPSMTDSNKCYSLAGAVYGVWKNSSCSGAPFKKMTTDTKGHAKVDKLPFGNYWVKEITPSKGFKLDTKIYPISITETKPKATIRSVEPAGNDPLVITINKIWNGEETPTVPSLAGTQFTVWYYDNLTKDVSGKPKKTWVLEVKQQANGVWRCSLQDKYLVKEKSDDFYRDPDTKLPVLPYGTYKIQETQHAPGYTFEGTWGNKDGSVSMSTSEPYITVVDKTTTGGINLWGGNEYTGQNKPHDTSIKIRKVDENGRPLAGAKFKLVNSKGKLVSTKTSGSDGYVTWDKLYPDIYTVTEIQAPNGKNLLADDIEIHLPMRITEEDIKKYNIDRSKLSEWDKEEQCYYLFDVTYEISNHATFEAPMTGGFTDFMTFLPLVGGMAGFAGVGAVAMKKKRKREE